MSKPNPAFWRSARSAFDSFWIVAGLVTTSLGLVNLIHGVFKFGLSDIFARLKGLYIDGVRLPILNLFSWLRLPSVLPEIVDVLILWMLIGGIVGRAALLSEQRKRKAAARLESLAASAENPHEARLGLNLALVLRSADVSIARSGPKLGLFGSALLVAGAAVLWPLVLFRQLSDPLVYETIVGAVGGKDWALLVDSTDDSSKSALKISVEDFAEYGFRRDANPILDVRVVLMAQVVGVLVCLVAWIILNALPNAYSA